MKNLAPKLRRSLLLQVLIIVFLTPGLVLMPVQVGANPSGGQVVVGDVNFQGLGTAILDINNLSQKAIINWESFSIDAGEITRINQDAGAFTLNRVISGNPSAIYGRLEAANGGVAVINPNGILVGAGGVVDVAGMMLMSTLDVDNGDFLDGGSNRFKGNSSAGISNYGSITSQNGDVVLLANFLQNPGSVSASRGTVAFGAGGDILVDQGPDGTTISVQSGGSGGAVGIDNSGTINAAAAELKAHGNVYALAIKNDGLVRASGYNFRGGKLTLSAGSSGSIVNTGTLQARTSDGRGGQINIDGGDVNLAAGIVDVSADLGRDGGRVDVKATDLTVGSGTSITADGVGGGTVNLDASRSLRMAGTATSKGSHSQGGNVNLTGDLVEVQSTALVDVSGFSGGAANIGGGFQGKDATLRNASTLEVAEGALIIADGAMGNGGTLVFWSDEDTTFRAEASAQALGFIGNGGLIEVSGRDRLTFRGVANTTAAYGRTGLLLLDPTNISIVATGVTSGGTISQADVNAALKTNNLILHTGGAGADPGHILVDNDVFIEWGTPNTAPGAAENFHSFTLLATGDITVEGNIISHGAGNVNLFAGWDGVTGIPSAAALIAGTDRDFLGAIDFNGLRAFGTPGVGIGTVYINHVINDQAVQVGSRFGETNVIAMDLRLDVPAGGSDRFAHLGYRATTNWQSGGAGVYGLVSQSNFRYSTAAKDPLLINAAVIDLRTTLGSDLRFDATKSGDINVEVERNIFLTGETIDDTRKYTQIGHGGTTMVRDSDLHPGGNSNETQFSLINADHSGDIRAIAGRSQPAVIFMQAGREFGYSMIGHGGISQPDSASQNRGRGSHMGNIEVVNRSGSIFANGNPSTGGWGGYTQIGHGGSRASRLGSTVEGALTADRYIPGVDDYDTALGPQAFDPDRRYNDNPQGFRGNISVRAEGGSVSFQAGSSDRSHAQIGHGGQESPANVGMFAANGDVLERADISVYARDNVIFTSPVDNDNIRHVQIGHGGFRSPGNHAGNVDVNAVNGKVEFRGGKENGHAMVGHGGGGGYQWDRNVQGTKTGNISVNAGTDIIFRSGLGFATFPFSQIGHGGINQNALSGTTMAAGLMNGHHGNITVTAGGAIDFMSSQPESRGPAGDANTGSNASDQAYSMIGHGGIFSKGDHYGTITVNGESIRFEAVGGWTGYKGADYIDPNTLLPAPYAAGDVRGAQNFVQIGHGGYYSSFANTTNFGGTLGVTLGGLANTARDSTIRVTATSGDISFIAPQMATIDAQGAYLRSLTNGAFFDELYIFHHTNHSWAKIGHTDSGNSNYDNGTAASGIYGDIYVTANAGAISFVGTDFKQEYTADSRNPSAYRDAFSSRRSEQNFAGIGHGAINMSGFKGGNIVVIARDDILLEAGLGRHDQVMVGHGGWDEEDNALETREMFDGSITVQSTAGNVVLQGGNGGGPGLVATIRENGVEVSRTIFSALEIADYSWAQIGHGGRNNGGNVVGGDDFITVLAGGDVRVLAGQAFRNNFAMIGHGGSGSRANLREGDITVTARNNIYLKGTESGLDQVANFAQIGHGGFDSDINTDGVGNGNVNGLVVRGTINVTAETGDIIMVAGVDNTTAESGGAGNFTYDATRVLQAGLATDTMLTGYAGNAANTRHTDFGPGPDGLFGFGADNIAGTADDDLAQRADNWEQPGADGDYTTTADNTYGGVLGTPQSLGYMYAGRGSKRERYDNDNNVTVGVDGILLTQDDANQDFDANIRAQGGYAQIGHGGQHTNITIVDQDINVTAGNDLTAVAGEFRDAKVAIGHNSGPDGWGNDQARRRSQISGDIDVTVGRDLTLLAGSGDNASVKIGMGEYTTAQDRNTLETPSAWGGDIHVKVGNAALFDASETSALSVNVPTFMTPTGTTTLNRPGLQNTFAGGADYSRVLIGHRDTDDNWARHGGVNSFGDTIIEVSRNQPDYWLGGAMGSFTSRVSANNLNGVVFSSASDGLTGFLKFYMPNRPQNVIANGTLMNTTRYVNPDFVLTDGIGGPAVSLAGGNSRGDEYLDFFGSTETTEPDGPSNFFNGLGSFYSIYYNNRAPIVPPTPVIPTPVTPGGLTEAELWAFLDEKVRRYDTFEREDDAGFEREDDANFEREDESDFEQEDDAASAYLYSLGGESFTEEDEEDSELRKEVEELVGGGRISFQFYDPGMNRYSSFRLFGTPAAVQGSIPSLPGDTPVTVTP